MVSGLYSQLPYSQHVEAVASRTCENVSVQRLQTVCTAVAVVACIEYVNALVTGNTPMR